MIKNSLGLLLTVAVNALLISGCMTAPKGLESIQQLPATTFVLPVDYIDAYVNTGEYYQRCFSKQGVSYPITVMNNGSPVTITNRTPDTSVHRALNRDNKTATVSIYNDSTLAQYITFSATDNNVTSVSNFAQKPTFMSAKTYQQTQTKQVELLKKVILQEVSHCP